MHISISIKFIQPHKNMFLVREILNSSQTHTHVGDNLSCIIFHTRFLKPFRSQTSELPIAMLYLFSNNIYLHLNLLPSAICSLPFTDLFGFRIIRNVVSGVRICHLIHFKTGKEEHLCGTLSIPTDNFQFLLLSLFSFCSNETLFLPLFSLISFIRSSALTIFISHFLFLLVIESIYV